MFRRDEEIWFLGDVGQFERFHFALKFVTHLEFESHRGFSVDNYGNAVLLGIFKRGVRAVQIWLGRLDKFGSGEWSHDLFHNQWGAQIFGIIVDCVREVGEFVTISSWLICSESDLSCRHSRAQFFFSSTDNMILRVEFDDVVLQGEWFDA
jgi:hypothetical protein